MTVRSVSFKTINMNRPLPGRAMASPDISTPLRPTPMTVPSKTRRLVTTQELWPMVVQDTSSICGVLLTSGRRRRTGDTELSGKSSSNGAMNTQCSKELRGRAGVVCGKDGFDTDVDVTVDHERIRGLPLALEENAGGRRHADIRREPARQGAVAIKQSVRVHDKRATCGWQGRDRSEDRAQKHGETSQDPDDFRWRRAKTDWSAVPGSVNSHSSLSISPSCAHARTRTHTHIKLNTEHRKFLGTWNTQNTQRVVRNAQLLTKC